MSYTDERRSFRPATLGTVAAVHIGIGYALVSGLAYQVIHTGPSITSARLIPDDPVPPPKLPPAEMPRAASAEPRAADPIVHVPIAPLVPVTVADIPATMAIGSATETTPLSKAVDSLSRVALPEGDKSAWVTSEDYPASALRDGIEGTVAIDVAIDVRGRVSGCIIVSGSGNEALDQTTCRIYARRARYRPALDENGQPTPTHRADRIRWEIPR